METVETDNHHYYEWLENELDDLSQYHNSIQSVSIANLYTRPSTSDIST